MNIKQIPLYQVKTLLRKQFAVGTKMPLEEDPPQGAGRKDLPSRVVACIPPSADFVDLQLQDVEAATAAPSPDSLPVKRKDIWFHAYGSELIHKRLPGQPLWICSCKRSVKKPTVHSERDILWSGTFAEISESGRNLCPRKLCAP